MSFPARSTQSRLSASRQTCTPPDNVMPDFDPPLPADFSELAVLLDVDGTILDLAPTPREVFVPHSLRETLARLWQRTGRPLTNARAPPVRCHSRSAATAPSFGPLPGRSRRRRASPRSTR